jgi:hypothetical protein
MFSAVAIIAGVGVLLWYCLSSAKVQRAAAYRDPANPTVIVSQPQLPQLQMMVQQPPVAMMMQQPPVVVPVAQTVHTPPAPTTAVELPGVPSYYAPPPASDPGAMPDEELTTADVRTLRARAAADGCDAAAIEDARDSVDPRTALIDLIVEAARAKAAAVPPLDLDALLAQLSQLTVRELRTRAAADGADNGLIEDARDGLDPVAELIALIVQQAQKDVGRQGP